MTNIISKVRDLELVQGVFFTADIDTKENQYLNAKRLFKEILLGDIEYEHELVNDGNGEVLTIKSGEETIRFNLCQEHRNFCIY